MTDKRCPPESTSRLAGCILILWASAALAAPPTPRERGSVGMAEEGPTTRRAPVPGREVKFPTDKALPMNRFGVFVGIDQYEHLSQEALDGCVNDTEVMRTLFADRFAFKRSALLTNGKATRKAILEVLDALVAQVRAARAKLKPDETITVVIYYAGHGSQVRDQATAELGKDEDDGWDETWVAHDSSRQGDRDVRDDEIGMVYRELIRLGAQVLLISDSCHSGTVHRSAEFAKTRMIRRKDPGPGPALHKFRSIADRGRPGPRGEAQAPSGVVDGQALPGFVAYTACRATEKASEDKDDAGQPCGRFTKVLRHLLGAIPENTTYASLHRQILVEFEKRYRYRRQTPQFHSIAAKRGELFLKGGYPTPHAAIVPGSRKGRSVSLRMGLLHGVTVGSVFHFYANLDDLRKERNRIATGSVQAVAPETCTVRLARQDVALPDTAKAKLDSVRMDDLKVHVAGDLPQPMTDVLAQLDKNQQLRLVDRKSDFGIAIYHDAKDKAVRFYSPEALPDPKRPKATWPAALREFRYKDPAEGAKRLSRSLLFLARLQRLMTLSRNAGKIEVTIVAGPAGAAPQEPASPDGGIVRLRQGDKFAIRLKNNGTRPLYVTMFAFNPVAESKDAPELRPLTILYPQFGDEVEVLAPGAERLIPDFEATAEQALERTTIKVLATESNIDFSPLVVPPDPTRGALRKELQTRTRGGPIRGAGSPLFSLLQDAMHGGPATRGARRTVTRETYWATTTLIFDVAKPKPRDKNPP